VAVSCPFLFNWLFYEVFVIKLPIKINRRISLGLYVSNLPPPLKSVPMESLFSTAGLLLNSKRSALAPYKVNMLTFNHDNYKFL